MIYENKELILAVILSICFGGLFAGGFLLKEKFMRFMQGRNGVDQFARFTMGVALAAIVLTLFTGTRSGIGAFLDLFGMAAIVYTYFRIFSKNISKRYQENQKYLQMTDKLRTRFQKEKRMMSQRKDYHIYSCPGCGQKIRIPRGGFKKVEIECPKCHTKFIKRR